MAQILMLCHDQHLDRRVVAQAKTLIDEGHCVRLLALSFGNETEHETTPEGIQLTRIGLGHIIPENRTYVAYMSRQYRLNDILNALANRYPGKTALFTKGFNLGSRLNWSLYKAMLLLRYHNRSLHDPLPFRKAFVSHARELHCDLLQVHDLPALEAGVELAENWGVPLVYDAHELYPEQKSFSNAQRTICSKAEQQLIQKAKHVFAVNDSIGEEMARRYRIATPTTLLNAIDPLPDFVPEAHYDLLRQKLGLDTSRRILLFQGGFAPHRNLENLIAAMSYVRTGNVDLIMMGFGDFGERLKEKAQRLGLLGKRIHFLPAVPQSELLQHSASADLGIIPYPHVDLNSYFCTPNKLFEFIQAGLPILANDSPELNRFVRERDFGTTHKMKNARDIARAIDTTFGADNFSTWKLQLKEQRQSLNWETQGVLYKEYISKLIPPALTTIAKDSTAGAV
jgi:glycosyltransferase involved in cell wall biosynthesis